MDGIINFFKPKGMTSHDAVYYFRRLCKTKKVGHTGTLDPMATGVLPICIGKATRVSEYLLNVGKEYIGELTLGTETDTQDKEGKITNFSNKEVCIESLIKVFNDFKGEQEQIPPMYSAKKINGKKLYELAREGIVIERKSNRINISELDIIHNIDNKKIVFYVKCSKGTYIRTLCNDIGNRLGTYGHMSFLLRVGVGDFKLSNSYGLDNLNRMTEAEREQVLLRMDYALTHLKSIEVNRSNYKHLINGMKLKVDSYHEIKDNESIRVYCKDQFIGIGKLITENDERMIKMAKVLIG
ncbi:MAG: tRNA pseudouridine(55) synthase TruB [Tissierellia bacterium]|nr:tRNA pseudouridine(55) synthase TruB [Tissierellia bacterium]